MGVPGGAKEGPPKPKRPPRRPPSAGNEGPGPCAAAEGGKDPSPMAVQGSAETAEPMQEAPAERPKGREEPARAERALRVDPLPFTKETSEAGPDSTTEGPAAADVAEGAQEGPPKDQLPRAPPSSDGDTGPETCVAGEGATEPAPEAEEGSADNAEPMQATPAEGREGEEELPLPEQELPRAPEASMGSADNVEPMQATPVEGPEGGKEPLQEQEPPRAPEASVGSADNAEPMQAAPAERPDGGKEPPQKQEPPRAPEASVGSADNAEPMQVAPAGGSEGVEEHPQPEKELPQASLSCGDEGFGPRAAAEGDEVTPPEAEAGSAEPALTLVSGARKGGEEPERAEGGALKADPLPEVQRGQIPVTEGAPSDLKGGTQSWDQTIWLGGVRRAPVCAP
ncbi:UNVERIFIED_CONTAM: hypothetical protein FKN15_004705 [Acipenser sinensis]